MSWRNSDNKNIVSPFYILVVCIREERTETMRTDDLLTKILVIILFYGLATQMDIKNYGKGLYVTEKFSPKTIY